MTVKILVFNRQLIMSLADVKAYRMQEAIKLVERLLPLKKWGFKQSTQLFYNIHPIVIYVSKSCRIRAMYSASSRRIEDSISIHYGKLEVPDLAQIVLENDPENYHLLWHSVRLPLYFLDGLSPQEARNAKDPSLIKEFEQSDLVRDIQYQPEKDLALHATIWETYGQKLFGIFDGGSKTLWERYSSFVSEYWKTLPQG